MSDVTIRLRDHGPIVIEGAVHIIDAEGNEFDIDTSKPVIALCRCGQSNRKPFCDGTHRDCDFSAAERARADA